MVPISCRSGDVGDHAGDEQHGRPADAGDGLVLLGQVGERQDRAGGDGDEADRQVEHQHQDQHDADQDQGELLDARSPAVGRCIDEDLGCAGRVSESGAATRWDVPTRSCRVPRRPVSTASIAVGRAGGTGGGELEVADAGQDGVTDDREHREQQVDAVAGEEQGPRVDASDRCSRRCRRPARRTPRWGRRRRRARR